MEQNNGTQVAEFTLLGFAGQHKSWHILFTVFLIIYVTTLVGNIGTILLIKIDSCLHTPMYLFLQHLPFVDLCYTSAITPKMLQNFVGTEKSISFIGCMVQLLVYSFCNKRLLYPFSYGSRLICSYLQPTLLSNTHVPESLYSVLSWFIYHGFPKCLYKCKFYFLTELLPVQYN